jgi:hypothetical protein
MNVSPSRRSERQNRAPGVGEFIICRAGLAIKAGAPQDVNFGEPYNNGAHGPEK